MLAGEPRALVGTATRIMLALLIIIIFALPFVQNVTG